MQSEEYVAAALRALAEQDAGLEAPLRVEDRVRKSFRRQHTARRWRNGLTWSLALAASVIVVFLVGMREKQPAPPPRAKEEIARPPQVAVANSPAVETPAAAETVPAGASRPPLVRPAPSRQPREVVTEFFPLLDVALPFEDGELLRVTVPASTMRRVGLPVNENRLADRVYADVLVGNEGLARAIRFVSYEQ
jgi:hypothetical protein